MRGRTELTVSTDASCSGRKAACTAVLMADGQIAAERSQRLFEVDDGYDIAAEIGAVALAAELVTAHAPDRPVVVEIDNPRVLLEGAMPPQAERIPTRLLSHATGFIRSDGVMLRVLPRNASAGLRRADRLARWCLWRR